MKKTAFSKLLAFILCTVLIAAAALFTAGCTDSNQADEGGQDDSLQAEITTVGDGNTCFAFIVVGPDEAFAFDVHTDEATVGAALTDLGLIEGEEGPYGLYVKTVNGITLDYDADGMYWAFYEGNAYASAGVDETEIQEGASYSFKAEKS